MKIGNEIEIMAYKHGAVIRLIIKAPRNVRIERKPNAGSKKPGNT